MRKIKLLLLFLLPMIGMTQVYVDSIPGEQIVKHMAYTLSYNEECEGASWVSYLNTTEHLTNTTTKRKNLFKYDPLVVTKSASSNDYSKTGYDRGHLCPSADMLWNDTTMSESFYMSNMSPQLPGFNRGIWKSLESYVREFSITQDSVYVITGPSFTTINKKIGINEVCVPEYYYKIISYKKGGVWTVFCWLLPNESSDKDLTFFMVDITMVESVTGLNFKMK